jgi:hypothetical protein
MNNILNTILYIMSPLLIIGGILALVGVCTTYEPGALAIPVVLVNGIVPVATGIIITVKCIANINSVNDC